MCILVAGCAERPHYRDLPRTANAQAGRDLWPFLPHSLPGTGVAYVEGRKGPPRGVRVARREAHGHLATGDKIRIGDSVTLTLLAIEGVRRVQAARPRN